MGRGLYNGKPPGDQSPYTARYSNYGRMAICFHCRSVMRLDQEAGDGTFMEHFDVDHTNRRGRNLARVQVQGVNQICPGSGKMPLPLAYKFPDGDPLPYHSRY